MRAGQPRGCQPIARELGQPSPRWGSNPAIAMGRHPNHLLDRISPLARTIRPDQPGAPNDPGSVECVVPC